MEMVRDGRKVWPYCSKCGCRLSIIGGGPDLDKFIISHFGDDPKIDARGHRCDEIWEYFVIDHKDLTNFIS